MELAQAAGERRATEDLARRAGLSRATVYRILAGQTDPRVDDLRELLLASGLDLALASTPVSDPAAVTAARHLLGDLPGAIPDDAIAWTERLERYGDGTAASIIREAGLASKIAARAGAVPLSGRRWTIDRLVSAGRASLADWALSGAASLESMGHEARGPIVLWSARPTVVLQLLADTLTWTTPEHAEVIVVPADPLVFSGTVTVDDVVLVSPLQALIDCIGLGAEAAEIASAIAEDWR